MLEAENVTIIANFDVNEAGRESSVEDMRIQIRVDKLYNSFNDFLGSIPAFNFKKTIEEVNIDGTNGVKWMMGEIFGVAPIIVYLPKGDNVYSLSIQSKAQNYAGFFGQVG